MLANFLDNLNVGNQEIKAPNSRAREKFRKDSAKLCSSTRKAELYTGAVIFHGGKR